MSNKQENPLARRQNFELCEEVLDALHLYKKKAISSFIKVYSLTVLL